MFEKWKTRYDNGWATESQIRRLVKLGALSSSEFELITGKPY